MDNQIGENSQNRTENLYVLKGFVYGPQDPDSLEETRIGGAIITVSGPQDATLVSDLSGNFSSGLLEGGKYKLTFSDQAQKYYAAPKLINLDHDLELPIFLHIAGDKRKKERKDALGAGYLANVIHGFALSRRKMPLSGITVQIKSVLLEKKKQGVLGKVFSKAASLFRRVAKRRGGIQAQTKKQESINIALKTNKIGRFSTKKLPNGSYIVSCADPSGKNRFSSRFIVLKGKPISPLFFTGYTQEDIEELKKKHLEQLQRAKAEQNLLQERQKQQALRQRLERQPGRTEVQKAAQEARAIKLSQASRETLSSRARLPFGQRGAGFAGKAGQSATRAGAAGAKLGARAGMMGARMATQAALTAVRVIPLVAATPVGWIAVGIGVVLVLIIIIIFFFGPGSPAQPFLGGTDPRDLGTDGSGGRRTSVCSSGSLDYYIPFRDAAVLPADPEAVKQQVLGRFPQAKIEYWDQIVLESQSNGWNPAFLLALWINKTGASHHTRAENGGGGIGPLSLGHLGCATWENQTIEQSLSCVFRAFGGYTNFEDFMCAYGGDVFKKAPCTFNSKNPNFPPGIRDWYSRLVPAGPGALTPAATCPASGGGWPTSGIITQGPLGAFSHARLARDTEEALDIADPSGPPVYTTFDGTVIVRDCVLDGDCSRGWGGYGNSVEVVSNGGAFSAIYGHLSSFTVVNGQRVTAGDQLGFMGATGVSTGIHLHWGFRGIKMAPPNIPQDIVPLNCDVPRIACSPSSIRAGRPNI
jgi:hypothetical protein